MACSKKQDYAEIKILSNTSDFVEIKYAQVDIFSLVVKDTIYPNDQNEYFFRKKITEPEFAVIQIGKKFISTILVPEMKINIAYVDSQYVFNGENKDALEFFDQLERPPFVKTSLYSNDTTAFQLETRMEAEKNKELQDLTNLNKDNRIDQELVKNIKKEIDYYYALKTLRIIFNKQNQQIEVNDDLNVLSKKTEEKYPLVTGYKPSSWADYAEMILVQKPLQNLKMHSEVTTDSLSKWKDNGTYFPKIYDLIMDYPNTEIAEKVVVIQLLKGLYVDSADKSLAEVFKDFNRDFPNSRYSPFIEPRINNIKEYYEKIALKIPEGVEFIEASEINNFNDLKERLKGDKYFIDIWATWCAPCLKEFKYNPQLDSVLLANGYKKLYLSVDEPDKESKWIESIKYFDLTGLNMMANKKLHFDLINNYSVQSIPKYFILDKNGKILTNDAPKPSKLEELTEVLVQ